MFKLLGALVALYTLHAVIKGEVIAKSGPWGRLVTRSGSPEYFWIVIAIYASLSVALMVIF